MTEHEASAQKLRKAREEGNSGISTNATSAVGFVLAVALAPAVVELATSRFARLVTAAIAHAGDAEPPQEIDWPAMAGQFLTLSLPLLLGVAAVTAIVSGVQAGGVLAFKKLFSFKFDLASGFKDLVSPKKAFGVVRSLLAASAVGWLVVRALTTHAAAIAATTGRVESVGPLAGAIVRSLAWDVALLGLAMGLVDALITRLQWKKGLRMKTDEVKREHRENDGDPEVKHARKRAHDEMMKADAINSVRSANVLIVNPTHVACALRYDGDDDAPVLLSSGEGELAAAMRKAAAAYNVPIMRNVPLARALLELPAGQAIPEELYDAVAEILQAVLAEG